jgi:lysophospholipase L1-like esterase
MKHILFLFVILLASCAPVQEPKTALPAPMTPTPSLGETDMPVFRYLALGDSYTIGEGVPDRDRWPEQLSRALEAEGLQSEVTIIARTGWTVDELWRGIQANSPEGTYDLVTLLIGVNDQYRGYPAEGYRDDFRFMLGKAIEYAGGSPDKVIVLSIPDWGYTPFAAQNRDIEPISVQIDEFNAINLEETRSAGAHYVDVTSISRMVLDDFELIAGDRLHPSGKMYAMWVDKVLPAAREILSQ